MALKYRLLILFLIGYMVYPAPVNAQKTSSADIIYTGTYSSRGSKGIYVYSFDRKEGKFTEVETVSKGSNPSFLAVHPKGKTVYSINENQNGTVMSFMVSPSAGTLTKLNEQVSAGGPAHISVDPKGRFVYVANYGGGTINVYPINKDGSLGTASDIIKHEGSGPNAQRQKEPHTHSAIPSGDGKFLYVSDLGIDKIMIYKVLKEGKLVPANTPFFKSPPGSGPRHFAIHPSGKFAFSAEELTSSIRSFRVDRSTGALTQMERVNMLPEGYTGANSAADIHVSPDGKFIYASNRGHNSLVIYAVDPRTGKLTFVGHESTGGKVPRGFMIDSKGEYVMVGNQNTDNIVVFKRDKFTGKLTLWGEQKVPAPVCIRQL